MTESNCAVCADTGEAPLPAGNASFREFAICGMCDAWTKAHPPAPPKPVRAFTLLKGGQYYFPVKKRPSPK